MGHAVDGLKIAATVILFAVAASLAFYILGTATGMINSQRSTLAEISNGSKYEDVYQLQNTTITGTQVVTLSEKYKSSIPVVIVTGGTPTGIYDKSFIRDKTRQEYVNPAKIFRVEVLDSESSALIDASGRPTYAAVNSNEDIRLFVFIQEGCNLPKINYELAYNNMKVENIKMEEILAEIDFQRKQKELEEIAEDAAEATFADLVDQNKEENVEYWNNARKDLQREIDRMKGGE